MSDEQLSLEQLKERARAVGYTHIQRQAEGAGRVMLSGWAGLSPERSGTPFSYVPVSYRLNGDAVTVNKMGEPDVHYLLS